MNIVDRIISQIVALQISLYHDVLRLDEETDARAIHDLHTDLMRLRGALRPFRRMSQIMSIDDALAQVMALTASVVTLQALVAELKTRGYLTQAEWKQARLTDRSAAVKDSVALASLMSELDGAARAIRSVAGSLSTKGFKYRIAKVLFKQRRNLQVALQIKRPVGWRTASRIRDFRYLIEAYPNVLTITPDTKRALHAAQTQLDNAQRLDHWCQTAAEEVDLQPLVQGWSDRRQVALQEAQACMAKLAHLMFDAAVQRQGRSSLPLSERDDHDLYDVIDVS